jgi:DNA-binding protein HU-beta
MNRTDLVAHVADASNLPKDATGKAVDATFGAITAALARGEEVGIRGFGTFSAADRPAREGRNPRTGEPVPIPASKAPKFMAAKVLKGALQR